MPAPRNKAAAQDTAVAASQRPDRFEDLAREIRASGDAASPLAASELADSIGFLLRLANGVCRDQLTLCFEPLGLRTTLYSILLIIHENDGLKQHEIGKALSIQQPNLVALITELTSAGLVERKVNAEDRRSYLLSLTAAGRTRLAEARLAHEHNERQLAAAVAPLSVDVFRAALLRIVQMPDAQGQP